MWGLGKLFGLKKRNKAVQGGVVNPAARLPAAQPHGQMQSLQARNASAGGASGAASLAAAPRSMVGAHRQGKSQRTAESVSASVDAAIAMAQEAVSGSAVADAKQSAPQAEAMQMQADYHNVIGSLRTAGGISPEKAAIADVEAAIHDAQVAIGAITEKPIMADGLMAVNDAMDSAATDLAGITPVAAPEPIELAPAGALEAHLAALTGQPTEAPQAAHRPRQRKAWKLPLQRCKLCPRSP